MSGRAGRTQGLCGTTLGSRLCELQPLAKASLPPPSMQPANYEWFPCQWLKKIERALFWAIWKLRYVDFKYQHP